MAAENEGMKAMLGEEEVEKEELSWMASGYSFAMPRAHRSSRVTQSSVAWWRRRRRTRRAGCDPRGSGTGCLLRLCLALPSPTHRAAPLAGEQEVVVQAKGHEGREEEPGVE